MGLSRYEQETIINFNQAEDVAYIYTCSKSWMKHLEKLGLKGNQINPYAREYECPKSWIKKPQKPRQLSKEQKHKLSQRLHQKPVLSEVMPYTVGKFEQ